MPPPILAELPDLSRCQLKRLLELFTNCKTWVERLVRTNDIEVDLLADMSFANSYTNDSVRRKLTSSDETSECLASTADYLLHAYSKEEETETTLAAIEDAKQSFEKYSGYIMHSILKLRKAWCELQEREKAANTATGGGGGAVAGGGAQPRIQSVDALKPDMLMPTDTPSTLYGWCKKYKVWRAQSNFASADRDTDLAYFASVIDEGLYKRIEPLFGQRTPILSDDADDITCVTILCDEFLKIYPALNRRLDYFRFRSSGQPFTQFVTELRTLHSAAEIETLSPEDHYVFKILTCFEDDSFVNEFLKLDSPTEQQIMDLGQRLESARAARQKLNDPAKAAQARTGGGGQGGGSGGDAKGKGGPPGGSGNSSGGSGNQEKKESKDEKKAKVLRCPACNWSFKGEDAQSKLDTHLSKCPAKNGGKCDKCGKEGFYRPACPNCKGKPGDKNPK